MSVWKPTPKFPMWKFALHALTGKNYESSPAHNCISRQVGNQSYSVHWKMVSIDVKYM